jgi:hypothetical protein
VLVPDPMPCNAAGLEWEGARGGNVPLPVAPGMWGGKGAEGGLTTPLATGGVDRPGTAAVLSVWPC